MTRPVDSAAPGYVCFAAQDWWYHNQGHSDFILMRHVAVSRRVLVVNSIGMRMPLPGRATQPIRRIVRKARSVAKLLRQPEPGFWVMSPVSAPFYEMPRVRAMNASFVRRQVQAAVRSIGMGRPIVVVTMPTAWDVVVGMERRKLVFNRSDKHSEFRGAPRAHIQAVEQRLLAQSDHVLYVSRTLMEEERSLVGGRGHLFDHGVDLDRFQPSGALPEPPDLQAVPRPRLGFFGALDPDLVDFELLEQVARALSDCHLVLIGGTTGRMQKLAALANVHLLGFKPYETIPAYGAYFDVGLMPWHRSDWIRYCNPIKLKEYLALGLPVVSTYFPELDRYAEVVRVGRGPQEFVDQVRAALRDDVTADKALKRRATVATDSWSNRARELIAVCERDVDEDRERPDQ